jgi:hypothetical protein
LPQPFCSAVFNISTSNGTVPNVEDVNQMSPEQILEMEFHHFFASTIDITDRYSGSQISIGLAPVRYSL